MSETSYEAAASDAEIADAERILGGWDDAIEQAPSIDELLMRVDAGSFAFVFED